jgi:hypothetical protein
MFYFGSQMDRIFRAHGPVVTDVRRAVVGPFSPAAAPRISTL